MFEPRTSATPFYCARNNKLHDCVVAHSKTYVLTIYYFIIGTHTHTHTIVHWQY